MPIYEYRCPKGHTFEVFQRMTDPASTSCETCGASPVEKVLYPVAVHFKGSGFYSTDYGRGSRKAGKDGSEGDSSGKKDTETTKTESTSPSSTPPGSTSPTSGD